MEIIERISDLLAERDKTAVELCKALDIQTSTMSTWKTRKKDPPARYMPAIANFLCVSLEYLLTGQERLLSSSNLQINHRAFSNG